MGCKFKVVESVLVLKYTLVFSYIKLIYQVTCNFWGRDISHTALSSLPDDILGGLHKLIAESVFKLKELPPLQLFAKLHQVRLTYPSHCCAFQNIQRNRYGCFQESLATLAFVCIWDLVIISTN